MARRVLTRSQSIRKALQLSKKDAGIKDGIYAYVSGTVGDFIDTPTGYGFRLGVLIHPQSKFPERITVWDATDANGQPAQLNEGDRVTARGWLSWSRSESPEGKAYTNYALRVARVEKFEPAADRERTTLLPQSNGEELPF